MIPPLFIILLRDLLLRLSRIDCYLICWANLVLTSGVVDQIRRGVWRLDDG